MSLGKRLKHEREKRSWSQKYVAEKIGITNTVLSNYERDYRDPDTETLRRLAELYEVTTDYLLGLTDNQQGNINISYDGGGFDIEDEEEEEYLRLQLAEFRKMKQRMRERLEKEKKNNK